ncbi:MAG: hypothetical protein H7Z72_06740 [Bacteroidetes bacterium]|nr:hypothetical protein [Fibrella sp.]
MRFFLLFGWLCFLSATPVVPPAKINGVNFVAPVKLVPESCMVPVRQLNAGWVALNPYAFIRKGQPDVFYNNDQQWWGERPDGVRACVQYAHKQGLKVLIKPHVWVEGQGWAGDFTLTSEADWQRWEQTYARYVLMMAHIARETGAEMLCVGTEFRQAVKQRPAFWKRLIRDVRAVYAGKLTYAANWDEYATVPFWSQLDYIGIDAYFPLSEQTTPSVAELTKNWQPHADAIRKLSQRQNKPVLFTEYGYRSVDKTAGKQWELPDSWQQKAPANMAAQTNAYVALYQTFWQQPWFAGGFVWKWYDDPKAGGAQDSDYTPQRKPAETVIRRYYSL